MTVSVIASILVVGLPSNVFNVICIVRQKIDSVNLVILSSCLLNLVTFASVVPMTLAAVVHFAFIGESFCYVQETATVAYVVLGFSHPALMSLSRWDKVSNATRPRFTVRRLRVALVATWVVAALLAVAPVLLVTDDGAAGVHAHGCHFWANRIDSYIWINLGVIVASFLLSTVVMTTAYIAICSTSRRQVRIIGAHAVTGQAPAHAQPAQLAPPSAVSGDGGNGPATANTDELPGTCR